jgi:hypothetical protein
MYDQSVSSGLNDGECAANIHNAIRESDVSIDGNFSDVRRQLNCTVLTNQNDTRYVLGF